MNVINTKTTDPIDWPKGFGASSTWRASDYDKLVSIMNDIQDGNRDKFAGLMYMLVDQYNRPNGYSKSDFAPYNSSLEENIVTFPGISLCNKNITGEDYTRFLYMMSGRGNTEIPTIYSTGLEDENSRMSILSTGFYFASGTAIFQGCVFPTTIPDDIIVEFGSATHLQPTNPLHTMFWRNRIIDPSKYIYHYMNQTIYLHCHIIDIRPRPSE